MLIAPIVISDTMTSNTFGFPADCQIFDTFWVNGVRLHTHPEGKPKKSSRNRAHWSSVGSWEVNNSHMTSRRIYRDHLEHHVQYNLAGDTVEGKKAFSIHVDSFNNFNLLYWHSSPYRVPSQTHW